MILILGTPEESEEQRREQIDFQDIPEDLWKMFPERDSFIPNIMKFCGYLNRYTIVKLKNSAEIQKMFDYVVSKAELLEDKKAMFGIFA